MPEVKGFAWSAMLAGALGAIFIALNVGLNFVGFCLFVVSALLWIGYGIATKQDAITAQNWIFLIINGVGIVRYFP